MKTPPENPERPAQPDADVADFLRHRRDKRLRLKESGASPYPARSPLLAGRLSSEDIRARFGAVQTGEESAEPVRFCGRMMTRRDMGKACFAHLQDGAGRVQIYVRKDAVGEEAYGRFGRDLDLGDILAVEGKAFRTRTGELSIKAERFELLSKSLRPLPEKWHGLKDAELRARQRELDLLANPESRQTFRARSRILQVLRALLEERGYMEVETPMMQSVPGGAVARPFETFHNALKQKLYLRVAPELYLKRCLVGGLEKVFEIGRVFRNEGIDTLHNPEFTILEAYESYGNMETMMELTEALITGTAQRIGCDRYRQGPFQRRSVGELFSHYVGEEERRMVEAQDWDALARSRSAGGGPDPKAFDHIFSEKVQPALREPTFVTDFPADVSPLAKRRDGNPAAAERFELYIAGEEIANAYSELNDPVEQRERLEAYRSSRIQDKEEAEGMGLDESFLLALEYGMPPAGGLGIGIDRLVMLFTGEASIRNVLLFPTLRPER